jgi:hypothetical protein
MEENKYIFTVTASGDRTNIMASFPLWDKAMFLENVKQGKNYGRYRYGKIGGYVSLLKDMLLEEFDSVFSPAEFTTKEITQIFRKEISEKYGEHAEKALIKPLSKKELERGCVYEDFSGIKWVYFGEVEQTIDRTYLRTYQSEKKPLEIVIGYGYVKVYYMDRYLENTALYVNVIKSPKKLMKKVEDLKRELSNEYVYETGAQRWANESRTVLKLL